MTEDLPNFRAEIGRELPGIATTKDSKFQNL